MVPIRLPSNAFIIRVPYEPVPKGRPRLFGDVVITPERTATAEEQIVREFQTKYPGAIPFDEPVFLGCHFRSRKERHARSGDIDNFQKLVQDALNEFAYTDDHWVHRTNCELTAPTDDFGTLIVVAAIRDIVWYEIPEA